MNDAINDAKSQKEQKVTKSGEVEEILRFLRALPDPIQSALTTNDKILIGVLCNAIEREFGKGQIENARSEQSGGMMYFILYMLDGKFSSQGYQLSIYDTEEEVEEFLSSLSDFVFETVQVFRGERMSVLRDVSVILQE